MPTISVRPISKHHTVKIIAPDLTKQPPRSPRVRLGGYCLLPRILDKCRAMLAKQNGEYNFDCPTDQEFFGFSGITAQAFKKEVAKGKSDSEMLDWVRKNAKRQPVASEIAAWTDYQNLRAPSEVEGREFLHECHVKLAPQRDDIVTWCDLLDLDDYVSFGGRP